jgi:hypothetical protein
MPNSSVVAAATKTSIKSAPCNYGVNHVTWSAPNDYSPWISMRLLKKFGGPSTSEKDGIILYEKDSNNYIFAPTAVASTGVGTITSFSGGVATLPTATYITTFTNTNGGAITLTGGTATAGVKSFNITSGTHYSSTATSYTNVAATGGSGTGARFNVSINGYAPGLGYTVSVTVASAGIGYAVGNTLTIPQASIGGSNASGAITLSILSITSTVSQTYDVYTTTTTSGSGSGAAFRVVRSGDAGTNNAYVSSITLLNAGTGYAVNDTVTISGTYTGGTSTTNDITVTVTGTATSTSTVNQVYENVAQLSTTGSGSGATFDVYRAGTAGASVGPWKVLVRNSGTGYSSGNTVTISASSIGGGTNLVLTLGATSGGGGLLATSGNYVTGSAFTTRYSGTSINTAESLANQKSQTYTNVPVVSASGSGRGAKATVVRNSSGAVSTVTVTTSGTGYAANDLLVIPASYIGDYQTNSLQLGVDADFHLFDKSYPPYQVQTRTTADISNLSSATRTLDGYTYGLNDLVLVANQTTASNNGLYKATSVASTTATLTNQTDYDGSLVHVINGTTNGGRVYSNSGNTFTQTTAPTVNPGKGNPGDNVGGKEVYYTLYVRTVSITGTNTGTVSWGSLGYTTDTYVKDTGMHQWLVYHLPSWYFQDSTDLSDFLALFAFHLEVYKQTSTSVFDMSNPIKTPEELLSAWLKQFGTDYQVATNSKSARRLLANVIEAYSKKGSIAGVDLISESITDLNATVTVGTNLLPDSNTSSFEQSLGFWTSRLTATSPPTFSGSTSTGTVCLAVQNGPDGGVTPYGSVGTNAVTGMGKVANSTGATATLQFQIGPRRVSSIADASSTSIYQPYPVVSAVGDYVVAVDANKEPYIKPGTKISSIQTSGVYSAYLSEKVITTVPADSLYYVSRTGTDIVSALSNYICVVPTTSYTFSMYFARPTGASARTIVVGIEWIDADGNAISSPPTGTLSTGSQTTAATWYRGSVSGTAPVNAVYASPYFVITSMLSNEVYYVDAAQFEVGSSATTFQDAKLVTISIPSSTTAQRENMSAVLGNYIMYGQGPIGTSGATITGLSATIESIGQEPAIYPTNYSASGTAMTLTVPTGHGIQAGNEIVVSNLLTAAGAEFSTTVNKVASVTSTTATTIVYASTYSAATGVPQGGTVSKLKGYNFTYTSTTAHGMVPGHQVTIAGLTPSDLNLSSATVIGTTDPYSFVLGYSSTSAVITSTVSSGSGTAYVDFGRSGSTRLTS